MFFLDCEVGQLYVGTRNLLSRGEMMPCVPNGLIASVHDSRRRSQQDAMLLWLEEHVRRLENGIIKLREEGNIRSISLFPEQSPTCSLATTYGVQVFVLLLYLYLNSVTLLKKLRNICLVIRFVCCLNPEDVLSMVCPLIRASCTGGHWIIKSNNNVVGDFNGEAVIGQFPLLRSGKKEFVYECCITSAASPGSIEGSYTFIPDRLADPQGSPFEVEVTRFPLVLP
ncbi:putative ApaG domain-containing protein [Helianthus annuus]|nr:putative ApaG domain-containing protein [Helianthus annuus]